MYIYIVNNLIISLIKYKFTHYLEIALVHKKINYICDTKKWADKITTFYDNKEIEKYYIDGNFYNDEIIDRNNCYLILMKYIKL